MIEARAEERIERLGAGRQLAQEEVFGREPPGSRVAANRALERAVGIEQPRADDARLRMLVGEGDQVLQRTLGQPRVGVEEQEIAPGSRAHAGVVAGAEPAVGLLDDARLREPLADELGRPVGRAVIDDDELVPGDALEAALEP